MKFNLKKFRELVLRNNYSRKELAEKVGCSQNSIGRYLEGDSQPRIEYWGRLADALGVDVTELLEDE